MIKSFYIDSEINDDLAREMQIWIDALDDCDDAVFYVNSGGGSVVAGMAMYDAIARMTQKTTAKIIGMAASAATYPTLACDSVEMARNATFMIHPVSGGLYGTIAEIERDLDYMAELEQRMLAIYAAKALIPLARIRELVARTSYLSAQEALDFGFVDAVDGLTRQPVEDEITETEAEPEPEEEKRGIVNRIFTLAGLVRKGEVIKAPVENIDDFKAQIKVLQDELAQREMSLANVEKTLETKESEFAAYRNDQITEINDLKQQITDSINTLEKRVKEEIHNRLASLGYDSSEMPAPAEPKTASAITDDETRRFLGEFGIQI